MLSGTAAMERMHRVFDKYKYYPVRRGYNIVAPFNVLQCLMLSELNKAGIPLNTPMESIMRRIARGGYKNLTVLEVSNGWQMSFFEDHADCKAFIEEFGPDSGVTVGTVGNMDAAAVSMGGIQERSSFIQFATDETVQVANCFDADGTSRHFLRQEDGVTIEEYRLVNHIQPEDPEQFWEDAMAARYGDNPEGYDTGSGWVDPE